MTTAEQLKIEILEKSREYYQLVHARKENSSFVPNETYVKYGGRVFDEQEIMNLVDSALDFWLTYGKYSHTFEKKFAEYLGVRWSFLVNSGSSANLLAFYTLTSHMLGDRKIQRGDEVITVAAGFPTTISPIIQFGAVPVFVDIELNHFNIDVDKIEQAISPKTKAIILAHTLGNPFDIHAVKALCQKYGLWLIEDNCDALGSVYDGQLTGTWGDIGTSSFYPPHHMTMGEGGAVYTNDPLLRKIILSMRDWGRDCWCESGVDNTCGIRFDQKFCKLPFGYDHKYVYSHFGFNLKATEMQAAIGCAQIDKLSEFTKLRRENFNFLRKELQAIQYFTFMEAQSLSEPSWFGFLITLTQDSPFSRNDLVSYLAEQRIQTRNLFAGNILKHPLFESLNEGVDYRISGNLEATDKVMNCSFWLGVYPGMTKEELLCITETIKRFVRTYE